MLFTRHIGRRFGKRPALLALGLTVAVFGTAGWAVAVAAADQPRPQASGPGGDTGASAAVAATASAVATGTATATAAPVIPGASSTATSAPTSKAPSSLNTTPPPTPPVLAPSRLPGEAAESWTAQSPGPVRTITGHDIELNECATVHGATTWQQQPYVGGAGDSAILEIYTFTSASAALSAYDGVLSGMTGCQATSRALQSANGTTQDATVRQTASTADAAAFDRTWTGVEGVSTAGPQTNHLYAAEQGDTVVILHFDELAGLAEPAAKAPGSAPYDVTNDPSVLTLLSTVLADRAGTP